MTRTYRCPPDHPHSGTCYGSHRCGCAVCRAANAALARQRKARKAAGMSVPAPIDATATRARILELRSRGWTTDQIARAAGVGVATVGAIASGQRPTVTLEVAELLAHPLRRPQKTSPRGLVDATGTRRRLQALTAHGWSIVDLGRMLNVDRQNLRRLYYADVCERRTRERIARLYRELWDKPAPSRTVRRARALAARRGWVGALAWDNIDDPREAPAVALNSPAEGAAWRLEEADLLRKLGEPVEQAIRALGTNRDAFARLARNHQRPDLARWAETYDERNLAA